MPLYSEDMLNKLASSGEGHKSILMDMASGTERNVLMQLGQLYEQVATPVQKRWEASLQNTDNRKFFQGYSEAVSAAFMMRAGWSVVDLCQPKQCLVMRHPDGREVRIVTLAFLQSQPREADKVALETLTRVVNRAQSDRRITILVRKWTPHDFDSEPVRRCIDIWLDAIAKGEWKGRYATFEDENIKLEFTRTDTPTKPEQGSVAFLLAPENSLHTMELVETRMVYELDNLLSKASEDTNLLVSLVTNTEWSLPPGLFRSLFYGRPIWQATNGQPARQRFGFRLGDDPALFQEDPYRSVGGVLVVDRPLKRGPFGRVYLNPWAESKLTSDDLMCAAFENEASDDDFRVMRWNTAG
jgi:hypothetical protein